MGSDNRDQGKPSEGAEALIRRVKRAKDSTNRESSGSKKTSACSKTKHSDVEGIELPTVFAVEMCVGMDLSATFIKEAKEALEEEQEIVMSSTNEQTIKTPPHFINYDE